MANRNSSSLENSNSVNLTTSRVFRQCAVRALDASNFTTEAREKICLHTRDCTLVLLHLDTPESYALMEIFAAAASQAVSASFAAINLEQHPRLLEAFKALAASPNHPLYDFRIRGLPCIMVYRDGWPCAFYNGNRAVQPLIDYAFTLACEANYHERELDAASSVVAADKDLEMSGVSGFTLRTTSREYRVDNPMRQYNANNAVKNVEANEKIRTSTTATPSSMTSAALIGRSASNRV